MQYYLGKEIAAMSDKEILDATAAIARQRAAFHARVANAGKKADIVQKEPGAGFLAIEKSIADQKTSRGL